MTTIDNARVDRVLGALPYRLEERLLATHAREIGRRETQEDIYIGLPDLGVYALADGMGGELAGDEAAGIAVYAVDRVFRDATAREGGLEGIKESLLRAVTIANKVMLAEGRRSHQRGMGSTIVAIAFDHSDVPRQAVVAWVGDSRCYRMRAGQLEQLTRDHSLTAHLIEEGRITPEEAATHPERGMLVRSLGELGGGHADSRVVDVELADVFLLCSDGLTDALRDDEIGAVLREGGNAPALVDRALAQDRPEQDNVSAVVIEYGSAPTDDAFEWDVLRKLVDPDFTIPQTRVWTRARVSLEARGLVVELPDPADPEYVIYELTPEGREALRERSDAGAGADATQDDLGGRDWLTTLIHGVAATPERYGLSAGEVSSWQAALEALAEAEGALRAALQRRHDGAAKRRQQARRARQDLSTRLNEAKRAARAASERVREATRAARHAKQGQAIEADADLVSAIEDQRKADAAVQGLKDERQHIGQGGAAVSDGNEDGDAQVEKARAEVAEARRTLRRARDETWTKVKQAHQVTAPLLELVSDVLARNRRAVVRRGNVQLRLRRVLRSAQERADAAEQRAAAAEERTEAHERRASAAEDRASAAEQRARRLGLDGTGVAEDRGGLDEAAYRGDWPRYWKLWGETPAESRGSRSFVHVLTCSGEWRLGIWCIHGTSLPALAEQDLARCDRVRVKPGAHSEDELRAAGVPEDDYAWGRAVPGLIGDEWDAEAAKRWRGRAEPFAQDGPEEPLVGNLLVAQPALLTSKWSRDPRLATPVRYGHANAAREQITLPHPVALALKRHGDWRGSGDEPIPYALAHLISSEPELCARLDVDLSAILNVVAALRVAGADWARPDEAGSDGESPAARQQLKNIVARKGLALPDFAAALQRLGSLT